MKVGLRKITAKNPSTQAIAFAFIRLTSRTLVEQGEYSASLPATMCCPLQAPVTSVTNPNLPGVGECNTLLYNHLRIG